MTAGPTLEDVQAAGFPMGGEPLVALDLADTLMTAVDPAVDLIEPTDGYETWWRLQLPRLPEASVPAAAATRRLRTAIRDLLVAHLEARAPLAVSVEDLNAFASAVPRSLRLTADDSGALTATTRWHTEHGGNAALAAIATETIDLLSSPAQLEKLRRCANPACSMLFVAETKRRQWCTGNICGNRARVARHYRRTHADSAS
ncbi:ABATE domain-containing protein [Amycolatopsis rhabdoformis]|uniref:ABATE domain-containing protein n=1 Tax=Amycolatopsis rhabdoformis TaxID=1448059 RepID=A0ABZ1HVL3_9PSEU|nr:ABATE domain-containing protein [Amycolatopsis rhabdoformis]WSE26332.1 ABATE domain-containing protein [Amycolatopsis rhabdoformis]